MTLACTAASYFYNLHAPSARRGASLSKGTRIYPKPLTAPLPSSDANIAPRVTSISTRCQTQDISSVECKTVSSRDHLLELLSKDSDVQLVFKDSAGAHSEIVPAHSQILRLCSGTLAAALNTASAPAAKTQISSPGKQVVKLVMSEVTKDEWLRAMEFIYPVVPPPTYRWSILETLLKVGDLYEITALKERVEGFIEVNSSNLRDLSGNHFLSVWKWIFIADKHGLYKAAAACINSRYDSEKFMRDYPPHRLQDLSSQTLECLIKKLCTCGIGPLRQ